MSAPLVVNTRRGVCWTRRTVTEGGIALYAPVAVRTCPEFVMATLAELAAQGITGSADVLPVPVDPVAAGRGLDLLALMDERAASRVSPVLAGVLDKAEKLRVENGRLRDRIAELEALTPAEIQTCRVCGAGYTYGQPCATCVFRKRMAAERGAGGA
ncbi:hypothetical protein AB0D49_08530 [Streptomyces sp. NPDC048290]|uniref:hypothetical protein n=1 Tax=Streptomyces sp. NPDC048290 TaxID=3155811 RepID=UPI0034438137